MATILIVDDRPTNREFLVTLLGYQKHRLLEASDGVEALAAARAERPDLVITDILMPTMDGYEFVRRLRADSTIASTPIVFYTAHYHQWEAQILADRCAVGHILIKPCAPELILRAVDQLLSAPSPDTSPQVLAEEFDYEHMRVITNKLSNTADKLTAAYQRLDALIDIGLQLASEREPQRLLDSVCHSARALFGAKYALLAVGNGSGGPAEHVATGGMDLETVEALNLQLLGEGLVGAPLMERKAFRLANPTGDPRTVGLPAHHPPVRSVLIAPIVSLAHNYGWICLTDKVGAEEFNDEDERLVAILAAQTGRIYENGSLYREMQRYAAQLEVEISERQRDISGRVRIENALREREAGLRRAQALARLGHVITRPDGSFESWSETLPQLIGVEPSQMPQSTREWLDILHPSDREVFRAKSIEAGIKGTRIDVEYRLRRADEEWIHVQQVIEPISSQPDAVGKMRWFSTLQDVTEPKRAEAALRKLNRALRVLSECNMALVRAKDEQALLRDICHHIIETGGYALVWVGYACHDSAKNIQPAAHYGIDRGYVDGLRLTWGDDERRRGVGGAAIREGRPVVARHIATDPVFEPWREEATSRGFGSCIALPLCGKGDVLGMLSIYAVEPDAFDAEELKLLQELAGDLAYGIVNLRAAEARERFQRQLNYQSQYDVLTGLANRSLFNDRLHQATIQAARSVRPVGLAIVNLDRFKSINDTFGQDIGDAVLKHVGARLTECVQEGDTVARLSGDEFAVLMTDLAKAEDAPAPMRRLLAAATQALVLDGRQIYVNASMGVCLYPKDGEDALSLLANAGAAMSKAKASGGNMLRFYAPEMNERIAVQLAVETDLRRALDRGELSLHFQPKVSLKTGQITGAEALIRWLHPERGLVPPGDFIGVAEETGLIQPIGEWVIDRVCKELRGWLDAGLAPPRIAINLSARQFRQDNLVQLVQEALHKHAVDSNLLELEITETTIMEDVPAAIGTLRQLKAIGVHVSLDDFGTGYSSLNCLKRLPIDNLKIDQIFVRDLTTDADDAAICTTVIGLAHNLKLTVIAEGVETEGQMAYLRRHNCDEMQGYYFSRPLPVDAFVRFLAEAKTLPLPCAEEERPTVLLVDDEEFILTALKRLLRRDGYRILTANSGVQALELLAENNVDVIVSDQRMPAMTGIEFLRRAKAMHPNSIRIVLSGYTELETVTHAVNEGAIYKFLTKPWDDGQLREHIEEACRRKGLTDDNRRLHHELQLANEELRRANGRPPGTAGTQATKLSSFE